MAAWLFLGLAIGAEIIATTCLKLSDGFSKPLYSTITVIGYVIAFASLGQCLKSMNVSIAYAIWAGLGTAIVAAIGMAFLGEAASAAKIGGIALVIGGVILLNFGGGH